MSHSDKLTLTQVLSDKDGGKKSIQDANAKLVALIDAAVDALVIIDDKGNIELFNKAAELMFLYSSKDVLGQNIKLLMPDSIGQEHDQYITDYLKSRKTQIIGKGRKVKGKKSNGLEFPIYISVGEVKHSSRTQFVGIIRDITEQEQNKAEAQDSRDRLSHASRLNSMGELAAGIAHEMNQPLAAISTYAQASKRLLQTPTTENQIRVLSALDKISEQAIRASEVINQLRTFVKKRVAKRQNVDLNKLIHETVNLAKIDTRLLDHEVILKLDLQKQPMLLADPVQIQQVLLNLIRNGLDAMEDVKGMPLTLISRWLSNDIIEVSVVDSGQGMDEKTSSEVFTPFFTTKETGMGMGLPVSQTIIHAHGGRIYFGPATPTGSVFSFSLPATIIDKATTET